MEPAVEVDVDGWRGGECHGALAAALVDLGLELLSGGGLGACLGFDPASASGAWVRVGLLACVPYAVAVLPFAAGAVGAARPLLPVVCGCHGPHASSFSCAVEVNH